MVVVGLSGKHVPKWEKKHGKLVHGKTKQKYNTFQKGPSYTKKIQAV